MNASRPSPYYRPAAPVGADCPPEETDVCIYGANAAGVVGAVQAVRLGLRVILLNPATRLGGMTTCGLSYTDLGNAQAVGGLAREFYQRVGAHYGKSEEWCFEPHVAHQVLAAWLREAGVPVQHGHYVATVRMNDGRIVELTTTSGRRFRASYFVDCSYEGDLMAAAGVPFTVGREANDVHDEHYNGQQLHATHQFHHAVDPYVRPGDPASGLLPGIDGDSRFIPGAGDHRVQAYNFRLCVTRRPDLRVAFTRPEAYDPRGYELHRRYFAAGGRETFAKFDAIQHGKADLNNHGACSTDFIGGNWDWPTADYAKRDRLFQAHVDYQQGYHWFMANDPGVPAEIRRAYAEWGLAGDEFENSGHWPEQLYVREARRMVADVVMTERHCFGARTVDDPVGLAAYTMDSHNCRRLVHEGLVLNEGNVELKLPRPFAIGYRSTIAPARACANLAVPVCLGASHIAYGSIRMEPVFMILAQSAVTAISLAWHEGKAALADVPYARLRAALLAGRQVLEWSPGRVHNPGTVNANHEPAESP